MTSDRYHHLHIDAINGYPSSIDAISVYNRIIPCDSLMGATRINYPFPFDCITEVTRIPSASDAITGVTRIPPFVSPSHMSPKSPPL